MFYVEECAVYFDSDYSVEADSFPVSFGHFFCGYEDFAAAVPLEVIAFYDHIFYTAVGLPVNNKCEP